jgi:8-oxo-dGTP pyrophosphatase MutT (NUDIX family)
MTHEPTPAEPFASEAPHRVLCCLSRHGGSMRIGPLVRHCSLDGDGLVEAINELYERRWVNISWRKARATMPPDLPNRLRRVERITTTRFGRWRHSVTWPVR